MKAINVNPEKQKDRKYQVCIAEGVLGKISEIVNIREYSKIAVITDKNVAPLFLDKLKEGIGDFSEIIINPGESEKNINTVQKIWKKMLEFRLDRKSLVINLGGGVVGDMGGFAASTYMRGIDFIQIPTTLLAQVDASVGGKVGIDFEGVKNLIGSFQQPIAVIVDVTTLETLPERELVAGFAEIIKHGLIRDEKYLKLVTAKKPEEFTQKELIKIIHGSCNIKSKVVELDEKEGGLRKILNFGHTIGHALEALSLETRDPLLHGEAISIGMVAEAKLSQLAGYITEEDLVEVIASLKNAGLPTTYSGVKVKDVMNRLLSDKKNVGSKVKWTLLRKIGEAVFDIEVPEEQIIEAINFIST